MACNEIDRCVNLMEKASTQMTTQMCLWSQVVHLVQEHRPWLTLWAGADSRASSHHHHGQHSHSRRNSTLSAASAQGSLGMSRAASEVYAAALRSHNRGRDGSGRGVEACGGEGADTGGRGSGARGLPAGVSRFSPPVASIAPPPSASHGLQQQQLPQQEADGRATAVGDVDPAHDPTGGGEVASLRSKLRHGSAFALLGGPRGSQRELLARQSKGEAARSHGGQRSSREDPSW